MTEREIIDVLSRNLVGGQLVITPAGEVLCHMDGMIHMDVGVPYWRTVHGFLFGDNNTGSPFFKWFSRYYHYLDSENSRENSWIGGLTDCASLEELELKLTVLGKL